MNSVSLTPQVRERKGSYAAKTDGIALVRPAGGHPAGARSAGHRNPPPIMQGDVCCSMYRTLGAHPDLVDGAAGTRFAVWAPNAREVSVVCNANGWKPGRNLLHGSDSGTWSGFVPGVGHGDVYKYVLRTPDGRYIEKSDPVAFYAEVPPHSLCGCTLCPILAET